MNKILRTSRLLRQNPCHAKRVRMLCRYGLMEYKFYGIRIGTDLTIDQVGAKLDISNDISTYITFLKFLYKLYSVLPAYIRLES